MEYTGPGPTDPLVRKEPPFEWGRTPTEVARRVETAIPPELDPDVAMWPANVVSRWPFTGAPTEGVWPLGAVGIDDTGTMYVCTVGGAPGTWTAVGSGTSVQINPDSSPQQPGPTAAAQTIPCDGSKHYLVWDGSDPGVDWMDDTGHIILPGMYQTFIYAVKGVAATTPGQFFGVLGFFYNDAPPVALDPLTSLNQQLSVCAEVITLLESDLPYPLYTPNKFPAFIMPTDATATIQAWSLIERLLSYGSL